MGVGTTLSSGMFWMPASSRGPGWYVGSQARTTWDRAAPQRDSGTPHLIPPAYAPPLPDDNARCGACGGRCWGGGSLSLQLVVWLLKLLFFCYISEKTLHRMEEGLEP